MNWVLRSRSLEASWCRRLNLGQSRVEWVWGVGRSG